jgi:hypothetical protein
MKRLIVVTALLCLMSGPVQVVAAGKKISAEDTQRAKYAATISKKWGPQIQKKFGMSSGEWTEQMMGTFTGADLTNLRRASEATSFDAMSGALFGGSSAKNMALKRPTMIGDTENDLVFTPLPPCRIVDTRVTGGPIGANQSRNFIGWTATDYLTQGGSVTNCSIPENASALAANVVAVDTVQKVGFLTAWPSNVARPFAATINFVGSDIGNEVVLKLCRPGCQTQFSVYSTSQTQVVVDVYGYYMEPVATPVDCTVVGQAAPLLSGILTDVSASCPTGYAATGGGCTGPVGLQIGGSFPAVTGGKPTGWTCRMATLIIGGLLGARTDATCCRIPGR